MSTNVDSTRTAEARAISVHRREVRKAQAWAGFRA